MYYYGGTGEVMNILTVVIGLENPTECGDLSPGGLDTG